jgi:hypothetical protein
VDLGRSITARRAHYLVFCASVSTVSTPEEGRKECTTNGQRKWGEGWQGSAVQPHHRSKAITHGIKNRSPDTATGTDAADNNGIDAGDAQLGGQRRAEERTGILLGQHPFAGLFVWSQLVEPVR